MKANRGGHIDQISNLPSNVIDGILQHLPIRDIVRTSILSRKWRYMWVSVPQLEFGHDFFKNSYESNREDPKFLRIITEILLLHNGPVSKFTLEIPSWYECEEITWLSKWILFLSKNGIKHLELMDNQIQYVMPSHIFSCQGLTYLKIYSFKLSLPPNFCGFKILLELHLIYIEFGFESGALERLVSGCPVLNVLTISDCSGCINVSAPSLKVFYIEGNEDIKTICFKETENLTDVTIIMACNGDDFEEANVYDFIGCCPKMERLCLRGDAYIEMLSSGIIMPTLEKSINLKYLELDGVDFNQSIEILFVVSLLKSSSMLVELVIKGAYDSDVAEASLPDHLRELLCNRFCLSQLRKVNITVRTAAYEHALNLIRFLLANSSSLEILTFKIRLGRKQSDTPTLFSISQDLLQMRRASQTAEVKFLHDGLTKQ